MTSLASRVISALIAITLTCSLWPGTANATCTGDCNNDGEVRINELVVGVLMALDGEMRECVFFDTTGDGQVDVTEVVDAVNDSLYGCVPAKPFKSIQEVLDTSCAFSGCHVVTSRQGELALDDELV